MNATEKLEAIFGLLDRASGPAKTIAKSLKALNSAAKAVSTAEINTGFSKVGNVLSGVGSVVKGAAAAVTGFALAAGGLAIAGGVYAAKMLAWKEAAQAAMQTFAGGDAEKLFQQTTDLAAHLRVGAQESVDAVNDLLGAGFKAEEAMDIFKGALDLKKLKGADVKALTTILGQIKAKGKLQTEELLQLAESGGLGVDKVIEAIGGLKGIDSKTAAGREQITKMLEGGKVDAATGLKAALGAITKMTGKELGGYAESTRNSLGSLWEGFKDLPSQLVLNADASGAIGPLKEVGAQLLDALNPKSAEGQKLLEVLRQVAVDLGNSLKGINVAQVVTQFVEFVKLSVQLTKAFSGGAVDTFMAAMKPLVEVFFAGGTNSADMTAKVELLGRALGGLVAVLVYIGAFIGLVAVGFYAIGQAVLWVVDQVARFFAYIFSGNVIEDIKKFGTNIVEGLWAGLKSAWAWLIKQFDSLIAMLPAAVKKVLGIASPSKVMAQLGFWTMEGFNVGIERASNDNAGAFAPQGGLQPTVTAAGVAEAASRGGASSGGGGAVINFQPGSIVISVGGGDSVADAKAKGAAAADAFRERLIDTLEELGVSLGAA